MNPLLRWFHQLGSPPYFDRFAARWAPWCFGLGLLVMLWGGWQGLFVVPADYQQGDSFRILYIHVPAAWMSMFIFALMALYAAIALIWRIKLCEILAMACAPIGAAFTVITLTTGSIWGKPMWGTWWEWDPRLTSELILLFLYLGVIGLYQAIDDRRNGARAAGLLAIVGVALLPVIRYSVEWWNSLHQGQTIRVFGESSMDPSMIPPLVAMVVGTKFWFLGSLLLRARADNLEREAGKDWVRQRAGIDTTTGACAMTYLGYVVAAYAVFVVVLLWDLIAPLLRIRRTLRNVSVRVKRASARQDAPIPTELQR